MIIHSIRGAAKFLGCSEGTILRLVEKGEMPKPIQVQESKKTGKLKRIWDSKQLEPLREKIQMRKKYIPFYLRKNIPNNL